MICPGAVKDCLVPDSGELQSLSDQAPALAAFISL